MAITYGGKALIESKYLSAADLMGKHVPVLILKILLKQKIKGQGGLTDIKPVFMLKGWEKGWVLNKTNLNSIAEVYGSKAEKWIGQPVVLYATKVENGGKMVDAIRVDVDATNDHLEKLKQRPKTNGDGPETATEPKHDETTGEVIDPDLPADEETQPAAQ